MIGRNELCPCGSGRKYKKCCLEKDRAKDIARNRIKLGEKQFNNVIMKISESISEDDRAYKNKFEIDFGVSNYELENLMNVYYLVNYKYNKQSSLMMDYFNKHKQNINKSDAEIIDNTLNSYMSVYQIKDKDINKILLRDIILNEDIYVEDIDLFSEFKESDFLLARIVHVANTKIFVDKVVKINERRKTKIKNDIDNRFKQTKKKCKTKKQCLINNIKFIYQNLIEARKEYILDASYKVEEENIKQVLNQAVIVDNSIDTEIENQNKKQLEVKLINDEKTKKILDGEIQQPSNKPIDKPIDEAMVEQSRVEIDIPMDKQVDAQTQQPIDKPIVKQIHQPIDKSIVRQINQPMVKQSEVKNEEIIDNKYCKQTIKENEKDIKNTRQVFARLSKNPEGFKERNKKIRNDKLEVKLKQRLIRTKQIQGIKDGLEFIKQKNLIKEKEPVIVKNLYDEDVKNDKIKNNVQVKTEASSNKVENIQPYKADQIESKIETISISKTEQQIESKIENNIVAKMMVEDLSKEQCKIYKILILKVEKEYKEKCIDVWKSFKKLHESYTGNENGWAAAIEYYVKKNIDESVTQELIAKKYDISASTLGKRYKQLKIS